MSRYYLYFAVFSSGMVTLAVELTAARLLGNVFGTSNLVWASIIGLILIYLTVGNFIGGRLADRYPYPQTFYTIMLWGAFSAGLVPVASRPILRFAAAAFDELQLAVLFGSFLAVIILFIIPITLLGTISPFAIRLAITDTKKAGDTSGKIYAISTLGSFIGTFLPVLLLIPLLGTTYTFLVFSSYLVLVALFGLSRIGGWRSSLKWIWMPAMLLALGLFGVRGPFKSTQGQIFESESAYNYIEVLEVDGARVLRLNDGQGIHSMYHPDKISFDGPWMQFLAGPFFNAPPYSVNEVERIAIVGLAAGTTARQATDIFGLIPIDGFEIDPEIIAVGKKYFGMTMPNLNAIAQDGRWGLEHSEYVYDLIAIDAYRPPYIPWHLTTREFFEIARDHLTEQGVLVINVGRAPEDRSLIDALVTTLSQVFPSVHVMDIPLTFNSMVYATVQPTTMENLVNNFNILVSSSQTHAVLLAAIERVIIYQQPLPEPTIVLTDDHAPVEWIVNKMVIRFIFSDNLDKLE